MIFALLIIYCHLHEGVLVFQSLDLQQREKRLQEMLVRSSRCDYYLCADHDCKQVGSYVPHWSVALDRGACREDIVGGVSKVLKVGFLPVF